MTEAPQAVRNTLSQTIRNKALKAPWMIGTSLLRLLYGFHVEGRENIPERGPYIVSINEQGLLAVVLSGYISIVLLDPEKNPDDTVAYMMEDLFALKYFAEALGPNSPGTYRALIPHSAGRLSLGLMDGYRALRKGGIVVINPEGQATWDGKPVPHAPGLAWLALHTAAPILPVLTNIGCYEVWPIWQGRPNFRGKLKITVGKPFRLCDEPLKRVDDVALERGRARVQAAFEPLAYGPGGVTAWAGPPQQDGVPVKGPIELRQPPELVPPAQALSGDPVSARKQGVVQLLWQCPVCHTNDALVHERPRFRSQSVSCRACGTRWGMQNLPGKDFRLKVVEGTPDLLGLDMALSSWYQEMKDGFQTTPISVSGVELLPGEEVYLERSGVPLSPYRPNPLYDGWTGREPPQTQPVDRREYATWDSIGEGRLLLTSQRLLWQGEQGELDFMWSPINAVYQWMANILGINYGAASYRFGLGDELILKWLFHTGTLAQRQAEIDGGEVTLSYY